MVLTGVITPSSAARALDWNVLFILAGSVGLGAVVVRAGSPTVLAGAIEYLAAGNLLLVVIVFVSPRRVMTNLVTNAAAASILTPVALSIAAELRRRPGDRCWPLIGTCISFTFINPFSHQSNLMVMRPGGYTTATFARFGAPLIVASYRDGRPRRLGAAADDVAVAPRPRALVGCVGSRREPQVWVGPPMPLSASQAFHDRLKSA